MCIYIMWLIQKSIPHAQRNPIINLIEKKVMHDLVERVVWNKDISHTKCVKTSELTFSFFHDQWSCIFIKTLTSSEVCAMSETMHCSDLVRTLEPALHNTRRHQLQTSSPPFQPQLPPSPVGHQRYRFLKNGWM